MKSELEKVKGAFNQTLKQNAKNRRERIIGSILIRLDLLEVAILDLADKIEGKDVGSRL